MSSFSLCSEANSSSDHLEKGNKSSYFKVAVKVSELIELDCCYYILFTKQFGAKYVK